MKLAVIGKVVELAPIPGADRIKLATVVCGDAGKWQGVVGLDIEQDTRVIVFLPDAILPPDPAWAFMADYGYRVRMRRFRKQPSEVVIIGPYGGLAHVDALPIGSDLTVQLGVTKYEKPIPATMQGLARGNFPTFLPKTDEPNFQTVDYQYFLSGRAGPFYITEKADGTSCTVWVDEDGMHVASRNLELKEFNDTGAGNVYWRTAQKYELQRLPVGTAYQFEVIGPSIQGNPHGLAEAEARGFSKFLRDERGVWLKVVPDQLLVPHAKPLYEDFDIDQPITAERLRKMAEIKYENGADGEGFVVRAVDQSWSFKVINLLYKD